MTIKLKPTQRPLLIPSMSTASQNWRHAEKIVALLESAVSQGAIVQHDIRLPVLRSPSKRTRQCDVVITFGSPGQEIVTIVEVQKRKAKVDVNTFGGWLIKMDEVGAKNLICVSHKGYPTSIQEHVAIHRPDRVMLLTLSDNEPKKSGGLIMAPWIIQISGSFAFKDCQLLNIAPASALGSREVIFNNLERVISIGKSEDLINMNELFSRTLSGSLTMPDVPPHEPLPPPVSVRLHYTDKEDLYFTIDGVRRAVKEWIVTVEVTFERKVIPTDTANLKYAQVSADCIRAFVSTQGLPNNQGEAVIVSIPQGNGELLVRPLWLKK